MNDRTLEAIERKNIGNDNIGEILEWANEHKMRTSSELIFGLPLETFDCFLDAIEFCIQNKIGIVVHSLMLLQGSKLHRQSEIEKYGMNVRLRLAHVPGSFEVGEERVFEFDKIVVSSNTFSQEDYFDIRKISLLIYAFTHIGFFRRVIDFLTEYDYRIVDIFKHMMNPKAGVVGSEAQRRFVDMFVTLAREELHDSVEDLARSMNLALDNQSPTRLVPLFSAQLIYESGWVPNWFLETLGPSLPDVFRDLVHLSSVEWIDLKAPELTRKLPITGATARYLGLLNAKADDDVMYDLLLEADPEQLNVIRSFSKMFSSDPYFHYQAVSQISKWEQLRYRISGVQSLRP
jgi:hypothetical protein